MQLHVLNSPFNAEQVELLNRLLPQLTGEQVQWLSGYLTAIHHIQGTKTDSQAGGIALMAPPAEAQQQVQAISPEQQEVTILYGSQTGNSQRLAEKLTQKLKDSGFVTHLFSMSDYKPNQLKSVKNLFVVVSTHGEGEPPDQALAFYEFLHSRRAPKFEDLRFSVLALGDRSYEFFCQTGKDIDQRLEELGGTRITPRIDCDVDFDEPAEEWMNNVLQALGTASGPSPSLAVTSTPPSSLARQENTSEYSKTNPFMAEVLENINLNGRGSTQETRHLELSLEGSNFHYEPGDCIGVYPQNHPELVDAIITELGLNPDESAPINKQGEPLPLREALLHHYEITVLSKHLIEQIAHNIDHSDLKRLLAQDETWRAYIKGRDLLDLIQDYSLKGISATQLVSVLRKLPPRLYSIASSYKANPDEAHLTIRVVRYEAHGRERFGVCSVFCAERLQPGDQLPIYVHQNPNFKLPADPDQPIIMIGPGTGVAPFRAFMEERETIGSQGKSWLFFGDRNFRTDFLYQTDWQRWLKNGTLTKMDVAFSRDTAEKIYVQHRMMERSKELYAWLEEGASVYVCGDEKRMAVDVHSTLLKIIEQESGKSTDDAVAYLNELKSQQRYQRDVY